MLTQSSNRKTTVVIHNRIRETEERLYCKRPIQCLAFSKILTPHPLTARRVCTPHLWCGGRGGHTGWVERGWGVNILDDARYSSVLYICKYFVPVRQSCWFLVISIPCYYVSTNTECFSDFRFVFESIP